MTNSPVPQNPNHDHILLEAKDISRKWGGLTAVDNVSLSLNIGEIHALIGTNGAGKSTLINLLTGEIELSAGKIFMAGEEITDWSQPRRARAGIGRSYQRTTIFDSLSVFENCRLCAQANFQKPLHWWQRAEDCADSNQMAEQALKRAGLDEFRKVQASDLSHGQKRQLEIALCLATNPKILLLDEPLAGMGAEESERMLLLLKGLREHHAILLVEHDMDAVFRVADRITVMVNGQVIASDNPENIRNHPLVQTAYLGEEEGEA